MLAIFDMLLHSSVLVNNIDKFMNTYYMYALFEHIHTNRHH